ncbi:MAG: glutamyl-tRNA reductase [Gammaproteobacteria bacterium]|nr:glutamyl-tRNA reductase [Gammaproteobacteria bacterium]
MHLLTLGLNHASAPLKVRERAAVTAERLHDALRNISRRGAVSEATILSTCNRTEIYCRQDQWDPRGVIEWLCEYHNLSMEDIGPFLYEYPDQQAVRHAFRVAAGLDSMILGEPQILGQMKEAFSTAHQLGATGKILNRLFQQTFAVAKRIRTDTEIGANAVSVAYAAVCLASRIFSRLSDQTVLLVGAGETAELTARHFRDNGVQRMIVANRTLSRARLLADAFAAEPISLAELPSKLHLADIVVTSTASTLPLLGKGAVEDALRKRKHRPMFMVDLAVPRDIEEQVSELADVYLYTVDDLELVTEENLACRRAAADEAEQIIDVHTGQFMRWLSSLDALPTLRALRDHVDELTANELQRARKRLDRGEDPDAVLTYFARAIARKFTHAPSTALNTTGSDDQLMDAVRRLFNLSGDK